MISKFLFFKKNDDERFVIGPNGFNNNPSHPLDKLTLWKFHNEHSHTYLLVSGDMLLATFTNSDELLKVLGTVGIPVKEVRILNDEINYNNAVIKCENDIVVHFRIGDSECISLSVLEGNKTWITQDLLCESPMNASQKIDKIIAGMFAESYQFVSETAPDENGLAPAWMEGIIHGQVAQNQKENSNTLKIIGVILAIIISAWLMRELIFFK